MWSLKEIRELARDCSDSYDFCRTYRSAYDFAKKNRLLRQLKYNQNPQFVRKKRKTLEYFWPFNRCKREALKYTNRSDFIQYSSRAYGLAAKKGWLSRITAHMKKKTIFSQETLNRMKDLVKIGLNVSKKNPEYQEFLLKKWMRNY